MARVLAGTASAPLPGTRRAQRTPRRPRRLRAATLLALPLAAASCGPGPAHGGAGTAVARTEAAGSARFSLGNGATGTVDFAQARLEVSYPAPGVGKGTVEKVREIGTTEYAYVPVGPLAAVGWTAHAVPRELNELQFPLYAFSARDKAVVTGRPTLEGTATTEYRVALPGSSQGGLHVAPHPLYLWLDALGRIRQARETEVETGVPGQRGAVSFTLSVDFTDFGLPVHITAPKKYQDGTKGPQG